MTTLEEVSRRNPIVNRALRAPGGLTSRKLQDIIVLLANHQETLTERILELESYSPKKVKLPDGKLMLWRCPEHLIPLTHDLTE